MGRCGGGHGGSGRGQQRKGKGKVVKRPVHGWPWATTDRRENHVGLGRGGGGGGGECGGHPTRSAWR